MKEALGIDFGGVILNIDRGRTTPDTSLFGEQYLSARPVEGAIECVRKSIGIFNSDVHIVSKAGERIQKQHLNGLTIISFMIELEWTLTMFISF